MQHLHKDESNIGKMVIVDTIEGEELEGIIVLERQANYNIPSFINRKNKGSESK